MLISEEKSSIFRDSKNLLNVKYLLISGALARVAELVDALDLGSSAF